MMNTTKVQESYTPLEKWEDDDSLNMLPIYWQSIREKAEDPGASAEFLTALGARIRFSRLFKQRWYRC
jgi:hypothetical protein